MFRSFYVKLSIVFLILLVIAGLVQVLTTLNSAMNLARETEQKVNRNLAKDIAVEFEPLVRDSINSGGIHNLLHYLMVVNPNIEIYLLNGQGRILAFFAEPSKVVKLDSVPLNPIREFLAHDKEEPVLGADPRNPDRQKPFSVAHLKIEGQANGYIYVILGGEQYDAASAALQERFLTRTIARGIVISLLATALIGLVLFFFMTRRLRSMTERVHQFEQGDFQTRIEHASKDELGQLSATFNKMADTIAADIEQLKRNDDLRRELVANVSHDLRSPLASVQGYLETVLIKYPSLSEEERKKFLETSLRNVEKLNRLVHELFELSKLDARQVQPHAEAFSIAELAQDVVMKFRQDAEQKRIDLEADFKGQLPMVSGDIGMIERVLTNLIENAIRFTPPEGRVKIAPVQSNGKVRIAVSDTGYGIPAQDLPHIFDRFYRVGRERGRDSDGTGLGLAIAHKIMELHGGHIEVESELDKGTTFYFDLSVTR